MTPRQTTPCLRKSPLGQNGSAERKKKKKSRNFQIPKETLESDQWLPYCVVRGEIDAIMLTKWSSTVRCAKACGQFRAALMILEPEKDYVWLMDGWELGGGCRRFDDLDAWCNSTPVQARLDLYVPRAPGSVEAGEDGKRESHYYSLGYLMAVWDTPHSVDSQAPDHNPSDLRLKFRSWNTKRTLAQMAGQFECGLMPIIKPEDFTGETPKEYTLSARFHVVRQWAIKYNCHLKIVVPENPWAHNYMWPNNPIMCNFGWLIASWVLPFNLSQRVHNPPLSSLDAPLVTHMVDRTPGGDEKEEKEEGNSK